MTAKLSVRKNGYYQCADATLDGRRIASNRDNSRYSEASAIRDVVVQLSQRNDADATAWLTEYEQDARAVVEIELY